MAWLACTPCIIYFAHGLPLNSNQNGVSWWCTYLAEKFLGYITDAILVMNDFDEKFCKSHYMIKDIAKIYRIPGMGVDINRFSNSGNKEIKQKMFEELSIRNSKKVVISVARLVPEKGVFFLLEAVRIICAQRNDTCFLLAGTGPLKEELKKLVRDYDLESNFRLLGWRNDINNLMNSAEIFILPSLDREGLPVAILEAMACYKPVISTKNPGCEDVIVDGKTGFLVPAKQVSPLIEKLNILLDNDKLRADMGKAGRLRVEKCYELTYCTGKIIEALEKEMHLNT